MHAAQGMEGKVGVAIATSGPTNLLQELLMRKLIQPHGCVLQGQVGKHFGFRCFSRN
jgi:hypothetical protein